MHPKMLSASVLCFTYLILLLASVSIEANSVDPDQTTPPIEQSDLDLNCLSKMFQKHFSRQQNR